MTSRVGSRRLSPKNRHDYRERVLSKHGPISSSARLVAIALTLHMDSKTLESFMSAELLGELTGLTSRTVRTALALLAREGWIEERTRQRGRTYWLKIRRATFPFGLPEKSSGIHPARHPEESSGTQGISEGFRLPAISAGLQAIDAREPAIASRLPENPSARPCKKAHSDPEAIAGDPESEILNLIPYIDPEQDPAARNARLAFPSGRRARSDEEAAKLRAKIIDLYSRRYTRQQIFEFLRGDKVTLAEIDEAAR